jgi:hypothetical protein
MFFWLHITVKQLTTIWHAYWNLSTKNYSKNVYFCYEHLSLIIRCKQVMVVWLVGCHLLLMDFGPNWIILYCVCFTVTSKQGHI